MRVEWTTENTDKLIALWNQGVSVDEIAKHFGSSHTAIYNKKNKLNLADRKGGSRPGSKTEKHLPICMKVRCRTEISRCPAIGAKHTREEEEAAMAEFVARNGVIRQDEPGPEKRGLLWNASLRVMG